ncbi:MAG: hypothetical protein QM604_08860 [Microbacterium sp.]
MGKVAHGIVYEVDDARVNDDFDDFDIIFLTVKGEGGNYYDCFTYVLWQPGKPMRPPRYFWERVPAGFEEQGFPKEYIDTIWATFNECAECPDFERPMPAVTPGGSPSPCRHMRRHATPAARAGSPQGTRVSEVSVSANAVSR